MVAVRVCIQVLCRAVVRVCIRRPVGILSVCVLEEGDNVQVWQYMYSMQGQKVGPWGCYALGMTLPCSTLYRWSNSSRVRFQRL